MARTWNGPVCILNHHTIPALFPRSCDITQSSKQNFLTDLLCVLPTNLSAQLGIRHSNRAHTFRCSSKAPNKWYLILLDHAIGVLWFFPRHTYCAGVQNFPLHIQHRTGNCSNKYITLNTHFFTVNTQTRYKHLLTAKWGAIIHNSAPYSDNISFITKVSNDLTVPSAMASAVPYKWPQHFLPHHFQFIMYSRRFAVEIMSLK